MRENECADHSMENTLRCNCCGEIIEKVDRRNYLDYLKINKKWNYFSNKDLTAHSFIICEPCYDKWISSFAVKVKETPVTEIFNFSE